MTPKTPKMKMGYETAVFIFSLMFALPASIALFPQNGKLAINEVESELAREGVREIFYNKGLWEISASIWLFNISVISIVK